MKRRDFFKSIVALVGCAVAAKLPGGESSEAMVDGPVPSTELTPEVEKTLKWNGIPIVVDENLHGELYLVSQRDDHLDAMEYFNVALKKEYEKSVIELLNSGNAMFPTRIKYGR